MTEHQPARPVGTPARGHDYTPAVYGSVLAATVIVSSGDSRGPFTLAVLLMISGVIFWLAHVYAATVASVHGGGRPCVWIPNISPSDGIWVAFLVAVVEQQLWGLAAVRHAKLTGTALTRIVALNRGVGIVIVALKLAIPGH